MTRPLALALLLLAAVAQAEDVWQPFIPDNAKTFDVRDFGAKGDGTTNDSAAFRAAAQALTEAGGGVLNIPKGVYIVGGQTHEDGKYPYYRAERVVDLKGLEGVIIDGHGATLRLAPGLHYGSFDKTTGERIDPAMPFYDVDCHVLVGSMFYLLKCRNVIIRDLELDGNNGAMVLGGQWGDLGRQLEAYGLRLYGNTNVLVENIYTHHHGLDGIIAGWTGLKETDPSTPHLLRNIRSEYNGRQGLSWVGGRGMTVVNSQFNHTGRGGVASAPTSGLDIEAEDSVCRDGLFVHCEFINNGGCGVVADSGDGGYTRFVDCTLWGTTMFSAWTRKPGIRYEHCALFGSVVHGFGSPEPEKATQYRNCLFEDREYPGAGVYRSAAVIECGGGDNILYENCTIRAKGTRTVWMDGADTREIFRGCTIINGFDTADHEFVSLLRGCRIENTRFLEIYPDAHAKAYYVATGSVDVGPGVTVSGPRVKWANWSWGVTGVIEEKQW